MRPDAEHGRVLQFPIERIRPSEIPEHNWDIEAAKQAIGASEFHDERDKENETRTIFLKSVAPQESRGYTDDKVVIPSLELRPKERWAQYWDGSDEDVATELVNVASFVVDLEQERVTFSIKSNFYTRDFHIFGDGRTVDERKPNDIPLREGLYVLSDTAGELFDDYSSSSQLEES